MDQFLILFVVLGSFYCWTSSSSAFISIKSIPKHLTVNHGVVCYIIMGENWLMYPLIDHLPHTWTHHIVHWVWAFLMLLLLYNRMFMWFLLLIFNDNTYSSFLRGKTSHCTMPSAWAVAPPKIVVLRDPRLGIPSNKIDSETYVEVTCGKLTLR